MKVRFGFGRLLAASAPARADAGTAESNQSLLAAVIRSTPHAVVTMARDGLITTWNGGAERIYGYTVQEVIGRPALDLMLGHGDDERARERHRLILSGVQLQPVMVPHRHRDGSQIEVELSGGPLIDASGEIVGATLIARDLTETQRLAREVAALEERQRMLLSSLPDTLVALYDMNLNCLLLDGPMLRRGGFTPEDYVGKPIKDTLPPEQYETLEPLIREALLGHSRSTEWTSLTSGVTYDLDIAPYRLSDGTIAGAFAVARDVGERIARTQQLEHSERMLAEAQALAQVGSWEYELSGDTIIWSDELCRISGVPIGTAPTFTEMLERVHPDDRELMLRDAGSTAPGQTTRSEYRIVRPDGEIRYVSTTRFARADSSGKATHLYGSTQDITDRVRRERERDAALERFEAAFDRAPIGMAVVQTGGRIARVNDTLIRLTGRSADELCRLTPAELAHHEDLEDVLRASAPLEQGADTVTYEHRLQHVAGHLVWVQVSLTVVRDAAGAELNSLLQILDITEQRSYENELKHMADHDPLTGLLNRRGFESALESHLARGQRYGASGALLMLDLDGFKSVNDTLGHAAGDEVLRSTAEVLASRLRQNDMVARLGGDEFAILLPTQTRVEAERVAEDLLATIRERVSRGSEGACGRVTASIGIAPLTDGALLVEQAQANADVAMYAAKAAGKDRCCLHQPVLLGDPTADAG